MYIRETGPHEPEPGGTELGRTGGKLEQSELAKKGEPNRTNRTNHATEPALAILPTYEYNVYIERERKEKTILTMVCVAECGCGTKTNVRIHAA